MKKVYLLLSLFFLVTISINAQVGLDSLDIYVPKGQTTGKYFKVFVPKTNLKRDMNPSLTLMTKKNNFIKVIKKVGVISTNQILTQEIEGAPIYISGSWIYFNLSELKIPFYKTNLNFIPIVEWTNNTTNEKITLIYTSEYYLGNGIGTIFWTILILVLFYLLLVLFVRKAGRKQFIGILCTNDGSLSMSLLQMGLWTLAVGAMVLADALLRMEVPDIPETLIMLMLFAAATTTAGQFQTKLQMTEQGVLEKERIAKRIEVKPKEEGNVKIGRFSSIFYANKEDNFPSIAKVQVLFWTIITLVLFIFLSIKEKKLWDVPYELVILMGISQATYLGRKQLAIQDIKSEIKSVKADNK